jgi:hypothetical protein
MMSIAMSCSGLFTEIGSRESKVASAHRTQTPPIPEAYVLDGFPNLPGGAQSFRRPEVSRRKQL